MADDGRRLLSVREGETAANTAPGVHAACSGHWHWLWLWFCTGSALALSMDSQQASSCTPAVPWRRSRSCSWSMLAAMCLQQVPAAAVEPIACSPPCTAIGSSARRQPHSVPVGCASRCCDSLSPSAARHRRFLAAGARGRLCTPKKPPACAITTVKPEYPGSTPPRLELATEKPSSGPRSSPIPSSQF